MNYEMKNKEILCTDAMLVTNTQISCNISAVAEVQVGSGSTNDKNSEKPTGTTANEQKNIIIRTAVLDRVQLTGSQAGVCRDAKPRLKQSKLLSDVTNSVHYARLATRRNVPQHCDTQRNTDKH